MPVVEGETGAAGPAAPRPDRRYDVFVSFRDSDRCWVEWVVAVLEANGQRCFYSNRDVTAGHYTEAIAEALEAAPLFLAVYSEAYFGSRHCRREWGIAYDIYTDADALRAVRIDDHTVPPFYRVQWRDLHTEGSAEAAARMVLRAIGREAEGIEVPPGWPGANP